MAAAWAQSAVGDTFTGLWGQVGWMALAVQGRVLLPPLALSLAAEKREGFLDTWFSEESKARRAAILGSRKR